MDSNCLMFDKYIFAKHITRVQMVYFMKSQNVPVGCHQDQVSNFFSAKQSQIECPGMDLFFLLKITSASIISTLSESIVKWPGKSTFKVNMNKDERGMKFHVGSLEFNDPRSHGPSANFCLLEFEPFLTLLHDYMSLV